MNKPKYLTNPEVRARARAVVEEAHKRLSAIMGEPVVFTLSFLTAEDAAKGVAPATVDVGLGSPGKASDFLRSAANECEAIQTKRDRRTAADRAFQDAMASAIFGMLADVEAMVQQSGRGVRRPAQYRPGTRHVGTLPALFAPFGLDISEVTDADVKAMDPRPVAAPPHFPEPGADAVESDAADDICPDCGQRHS